MLGRLLTSSNRLIGSPGLPDRGIFAKPESYNYRELERDMGGYGGGQYYVRSQWIGWRGKIYW